MRKMSLRFLLLPLLFFTLFGCRNDMDEYYVRPVYLRGNAYEYLKEKGNYTYFLEALDMIKYSQALDGRGLYSVFAPDDDAFKRFLAKHGKNSLEEFDPGFLKMTINYHLIEFSFNRDDFNAFTVTASAEEPEEGDGACYKFETLAQEEVKAVKDPNSDIDEDPKNIYNQKKFLPVISTTFFKTQESTDYEADYRVFFPNINWRGDNKQLYVANAAVVESGIPVDNGYMYLVDEVIDLLPTVYEELNKQTNGYGLFQKLYDRFAYFKYDAKRTASSVELGDSVFMFYHYKEVAAKGDDLPDLACEWSAHEETAVSDYEDRLKYAINCFAPSDDILESYIEDFFVNVDGTPCHYSEIPLLNLFYLLRAHSANRQNLILPSNIDQGLKGDLGETFPLTRDDIDVVKFCSNGVFYGINQVFEPMMFSLVMQPLFKYLHFSTMLNIANNRSILISMVDPEREYTIFTIKDAVLKEKYGYYAETTGVLADGDPLLADIKRYTNAEKEEGEIINDTPTPMGMEEQDAFISNHVVDSYIKLDRNIIGRQYYSTQSLYNFIYTEDGKLYGEDGNPMNYKSIWDEEYTGLGGGKGVMYELEDKFGKNEESVGRHLLQNPNYNKFYRALLDAKLIKIEPEHAVNESDITAIKMDWLGGERVMLFAPTNDAWKEGEFLPSDSLAKSEFLKFYFVPLTLNKLGNYILPECGYPNDKLSTFSAITTLKKRMLEIHFTGNGNSLSIQDKTPLVENISSPLSVETNGKPPFFATDGLIYGIDNMLLPFPLPVSKDEK